MKQDERRTGTRVRTGDLSSRAGCLLSMLGVFAASVGLGFARARPLAGGGNNAVALGAFGLLVLIFWTMACNNVARPRSRTSAGAQARLARRLRKYRVPRPEGPDLPEDAGRDRTA